MVVSKIYYIENHKFVRLFLVLFVVLYSGSLAACSLPPGSTSPEQANEAGHQSRSASPDPTATLPNPIEEVDPIQLKLEEMSLAEKIGQMVFIGIEGTEMTEESRQWIQRDRVGGVVLFRKNIENSEQTLRLVNDLKKTNVSNPAPLFIAVDEEGGRVSRMPEEFLDLPASAVIGERGDSAIAEQFGALLARQVKAFGMNVNFAPVLDVNNNPDNPVIGDRGFGNSVEAVVESGISVLEGIRSAGVIPVVKHFPGHGDTTVDSHIGLPVIERDKEHLYEVELQPFIRAIEHDVEMIMVAHILFPHLDSDAPSTFSKPIITDILRNELGYDGVVITDDMTMGAIVEHYDIAEAALASVQAGTDIVMVCHDDEKKARVIEALHRAAASGVITEQRIDESVYRILKLKEKYSLSDEPVSGPIDVEAINRAIESFLSELAFRQL